MLLAVAVFVALLMLVRVVVVLYVIVSAAASESSFRPAQIFPIDKATAPGGEESYQMSLKWGIN